MRTLPSLNVDPTNDRIASLISAAHQTTLDLFASISDAAAAVIASNSEWGESGRRDGQYSVDLDVDAVCVGPLLAAGYDVLSEA